MHPDEFYQSRKENWETLNRLLNRCQAGTGQLSLQEIDLLGKLYRSATSDLALAQREFPEHRVTQYLNNLVARGHAIVYRSEPLAYRRVKHFISAGYPRAYRQTFPFIALAALLFMIPALIAGLFTAWQPASARWLLPASAQDLIPQLEKQELWTDIPVAQRPFASSFIMQNNIQVSFMAFSGGIPAGVVTVWVMIYNGLLLGGISGLAAYYDVGFDLWTFVIGHGMIELTVIFIAGGAGLTLGWAVIHPGFMRRRDALAQSARASVRLLAGCIPLLVVAGLIEGFISPAENLPWLLKWLVGLGSGGALHAYLLLGGRKPD